MPCHDKNDYVPHMNFSFCKFFKSVQNRGAHLKYV